MRRHFGSRVTRLANFLIDENAIETCFAFDAAVDLRVAASSCLGVVSQILFEWNCLR
jgi:hypothetical protein